MRASYKCSLLWLEQCPVLLEHAKLPPVILTLMTEGKLSFAIENLQFYALWEKEPLWRDIQSWLQCQECNLFYGISQRGIEFCLSHLHESDYRRKQGSPESFSSVIIYYDANFMKYFLGLGLLIVNRVLHHPHTSCRFLALRGQTSHLNCQNVLPEEMHFHQPNILSIPIIHQVYLLMYAVRIWHACLCKWKFYNIFHYLWCILLRSEWNSTTWIGTYFSFTAVISVLHMTNATLIRKDRVLKEGSAGIFPSNSGKKSKEVQQRRSSSIK